MFDVIYGCQSFVLDSRLAAETLQRAADAFAAGDEETAKDLRATAVRQENRNN